MIRLLIRDTEGGEASFPVTTPVVIGRSHDCDICLADDTVSRKHARVFLDYGDPVIEDLNSPNGTMVNGVRINGQVRLKAGDIIQVSNEKIRVIISNPLDDFAATTSISETISVNAEMRSDSKSPWNETIPARAPGAAPGEQMPGQAAGSGTVAAKTRRNWVVGAAVAGGIALMIIILIMLVKT
jgi:ABC transport system ATP-binding/permease protein